MISALLSRSEYFTFSLTESLSGPRDPLSRAQSAPPARDRVHYYVKRPLLTRPPARAQTRGPGLQPLEWCAQY